MNAVRSGLFLFFFGMGCVLAVVAAFPAAAIGRGPLTWVTYAWARYHRHCAAIFLGIRSRVEGPLPTGAVLVAAKHQSMFETVELLRLLDRPAVILKRE